MKTEERKERKGMPIPDKGSKKAKNDNDKRILPIFIGTHYVAERKFHTHESQHYKVYFIVMIRKQSQEMATWIMKDIILNGLLIN